MSFEIRTVPVSDLTDSTVDRTARALLEGHCDAGATAKVLNDGKLIAVGSPSPGAVSVCAVDAASLIALARVRQGLIAMNKAANVPVVASDLPMNPDAGEPVFVDSYATGGQFASAMTLAKLQPLLEAAGQEVAAATTAAQGQLKAAQRGGDTESFVRGMQETAVVGAALTTLTNLHTILVRDTVAAALSGPEWARVGGDAIH